MKLFDLFRSKAEPAPQVTKKPFKQSYIKRAFSSVFSNTLSDLVGSPSIQQDLRHLATLRNQARTLAQNNVYARRYIEIMKAAVIGANGINVTCTATNPDGTTDLFNDAFTTSFSKFSDDISVCGTLTRSQAESLMLERLIVDGEALAIIHRAKGDYGIQIQIIDADHLDEKYFDYFYQNGNRVIGGVEIDQYGKPVAYHIWRYNPSDSLMGTDQERIRYDAKDIIHLFDRERASQTRGYSWLAPAIEKLHQLEKYTEATLVQARINASKARYFKQSEANADPFSDDADEIDDDGHITLAFAPNTVEILPRGYDVVNSDFNSSNQDSLDQFQKSILRGVAVGLGVSYHLLASDLAEVNYSSARFGALTDVEFYKTVQSLLINCFTKRIYKEWLTIQLMTNGLGLNIPLAKLDKFLVARYTAKSFASIDSKKDADADQTEYAMNLVSLSELAEKRGKNLEEVLRQRQRDDELIKKYGQNKQDVVDALKQAA